MKRRTITITEREYQALIAVWAHADAFLDEDLEPSLRKRWEADVRAVDRVIRKWNTAARRPGA